MTAGEGVVVGGSQETWPGFGCDPLPSVCSLFTTCTLSGHPCSWKCPNNWDLSEGWSRSDVHNKGGWTRLVQHWGQGWGMEELP